VEIYSYKNVGLPTGRLKMREWKMRYGQKSKGGKCGSILAVWNAEPILYSGIYGIKLLP